MLYNTHGPKPLIGVAFDYSAAPMGLLFILKAYMSDNELIKKMASEDLILEVLPLGILVVDMKNWQFVSVNSFFCRMTGYSRGEILGFKQAARTGEDGLADIIEHFKNIDATHPVNGMNFSLRRKDGTIVSTGIRTANTELNGISCLIVIFIDTTELSEKVREAKALSQRIEFILGATKTGIDIIDSDFNLVYIDTEWSKIYGAWAGRKCYEYFMGRDKMCPNCGIKKALQTKRPVVSEEFLAKEGNRPIQVTTIPFQDENGNLLFAEVNTDISERKQLEALREAKEREEALNRYRTEFLLNISHDIRTPLNAILGLAHVMKSADLNEKYSKAVDLLSRESKSLLSMIEDIFEITKSEVGELKLKNKKFEIQKLIKEAVDGAEMGLAGKNVKITLSISGESPPILADENKIKQIIDNLLSNAVKYTEKGSINVALNSERIEATENKIRISISIKDTGLGIPPGRIAEVFDPFVRLDEYAGVSMEKGSGLGLSIVKKLVDLLGGKIWVNSRLGEGSEFTFVADFDTAG